MRLGNHTEVEATSYPSKISDFIGPIHLEQICSIRRLKIKGNAGQEGEAIHETNIRLAELLEVCQQLEELEVKYSHWYYLFRPLKVINVRGTRCGSSI